MKVSELIRILEMLPPDARVVIHGYEGGYADAGTVEKIDLVLNQNTAWYYGPHEKFNELDHSKIDETGYIITTGQRQ